MTKKMNPLSRTILHFSSLSLLAIVCAAPYALGQGKSYTVQIASAPTVEEANALIADLKSKGIDAYWTRAEVAGKGTRYRVRIGKFKTQTDAKTAADKAIGRNLITEFIITPYEPPSSAEVAAKSEKKSTAKGSETASQTIAKNEALKVSPEKAEKPPKEKAPAAAKKEEIKSSPLPAAFTEKEAAKAVQPASPPSGPKDLASNASKLPQPVLETPVAQPRTERKPEPPVVTANPAAERKVSEKPAPAAQPIDEKKAVKTAALPEEMKSVPAEPAIATPAVAEALTEFSINNDNWKIVRRSAETDKNLRSIYFVDAMTGWAAGDAGTVYRTTDGGRSWKPLLSGAPANINFIHFMDWNHGWMLGETNSQGDGSETILFMTTNGGKVWNKKPMPNLLSLHFIDPKNGWAVGKNATLLKTNDGGIQWTKVDSMEKLIGLPVESTSYNYGFRDIQFIDALHGWLIGNFYGRAQDNIGGIFMTTDGGTTWQRVPITIQTQYTSGRFTPGQFHSIKFSDVNTGTVTGEMKDGEGRFFFALHTRDGGKTWEQFRTPSRATHSTQFLDLANGWMAAFAPREGAAEAVVYDTTLMRTDNGGMSWRNDFVAKGRRIRSVFFLSPSKGWAVGDRGMILRYEEKGKAN
jgi:photosystem II stability/assembly factor-like uncharacterized protein